MLPIFAAPALLSPFQRPDASRINAGIAAAVRAGKHEYVLPATATLASSIVIPTGTRGFALRGAPGGTQLKASTGIGYAIQGGVQANYKNYGIANLPTASVEKVPDKATTVTLMGALRIKPGDYLTLWDHQWVAHKNGDAQMNRTEIVRATKVNGRTVTLDRPVCREYDLEPRISVTDDSTLVDLSIEGISFDASYAGGRNSGVLSIGLVAGLKLKDLQTTNFGSRSISVNVGRDIALERCVTRRGADIGNPGSGYGPTFMKCHGVTVKDCESEQTRHGFMATNGSTDVAFVNCRSLGDNGNFDTHGFDERRISWTGCKATGTLNLGNTEYLAGGQDFTVKDCDFGFSCWVSANVKRVRVSNSRFWGVAWQSQNNPKSRPSEGRAEDVRFDGCTFSFLKSAFTEHGDVDGLVFDHCRFQSGTDSYTQLMALKWTTGSIAFRDCTFAINGAGPYSPIQLAQSNTDTFRLKLENCQFVTKGSPWSAVQLMKGFRGGVTVRNSSVATTRKGALFVDNQAGTKVGGEKGTVVAKP